MTFREISRFNSTDSLQFAVKMSSPVLMVPAYRLSTDVTGHMLTAKVLKTRTIVVCTA